MPSIKFAGEPPPVELKDAEIQTNPLSVAESSTEPMERPNKRIQTEDRIEKSNGTDVETRDVLLSEDVINMIMEALKQAKDEEKYFTALDALRKDEKLSLRKYKSVLTGVGEKIPVVGLEYGSNRKVCILLGESNHDSWCMHSFGRVLVHHKGRFTSVDLPTCPTKTIFAEQNQIIIGTHSGQLLVSNLSGETLWRSSPTDNLFHTRAVTCLHWLGRNQLFSAGMDGKLMISTFKSGSTLESVKSNTVTLSDLPRALKKGNVTSQRVGIVDVAVGSRQEIYLAGETGAIWAVNSTQDLSIEPISYERDGIEHCTICPSTDTLILQTPVGEIKSRSPGSLQASPVKEIRTDVPFCLMSSSVVIVYNPDDGLMGFDVDLGRIVMKEGMLNKVLGIAANDQDGMIALLNHNYELIFYEVVSE
ncbi:hypothetical protein Ddc_03526 [Ditylenchus destructor]|nr:hypothetical protein Ddc_03526 [Ditylenchus destructor]